MHNVKNYEASEGSLSVVIPVYNSASIFPELYRRLVEVLEPLIPVWEIIAVVDGTEDGSADVVARIHQEDSRVKLIEFSRNFGHQVAVTAGIDHAMGEMVVVMDDDLEDPPEVLPQMIEKSNEGFDLVYGIRRNRKVSLLRRCVYYLFYRVMNLLSTIDIPYDTGDFCLMRRPLVDALQKMPEKNRFIRGMRRWAGFSQTGIEYEREARLSGESGYKWSTYFKFALDGILSFSYRPLQIVSAVGFIIAIIGMIFALVVIGQKLTGRLPPDATGWASLMVVLLFLGGVQLFSIGIIGQYLGRVYDEAKHRPHYFVRRTLGIQSEEDG